MNRLSFEKVFYHIDHLHDFMHKGDCYPVHLIIGLTNKCNHACIWCYADYNINQTYDEKDFASAEMVISTVKEAALLGLRSVSLVGTGEPTLHPDFVKIVNGIKSCGVDIGLYTNGALVQGAKADAILGTHTYIRLSCSAANMEEHNLLHHAGRQVNDFNKIVQNVKYLVEKRGSKSFPTIGVQFAASHRNYKSIHAAATFWKELGVDYFAIKPVFKNPLNLEQEENEVPFDEVVSIMETTKKLEDEKYKIYAKVSQFNTVLIEKESSRSYSKCLAHPFSTAILPDGTLTLCGNLHGRKEFELGNVVRDGGFKAVWNSEQRKQAIASINLKQCPVGCRMHPLNEILWDLHYPNSLDHPNFL